MRLCHGFFHHLVGRFFLSSFELLFKFRNGGIGQFTRLGEIAFALGQFQIAAGSFQILFNFGSGGELFFLGLPVARQQGRFFFRLSQFFLQF